MIGNAPLSADHFFSWSPRGGGTQLDIVSAIQLSNYMAESGYQDKTLGGWMEDIVPWHYSSVLAQINAGTDMPILTGEDMYGVAELQELVDAGAVNYFHPDQCHLRRDPPDQACRRVGACARCSHCASPV